MPSRWRFVLLVSAVLLLVNGALVLSAGWSEDAVRMVVRSSARSSVLLFLLSFIAPPLARRWPSAASRWLADTRPFVNVSLVVSHALHLYALILLGVYFPDPFVFELDTTTIVGGGMAYVLIGAMAIVSFERPAAWMGRGRASIVDAVASYYVWLIFLNSFVSRALEDPLYIPVALALAAALPLRFLRRWQASEVPDVMKT